MNDGLIVKIGGAHQTLWGLPENHPLMMQRLNRLRTASVKTSKALKSKREKEYRRARVNQRIVPATSLRRFAIPAVNSVWSLAA